MPEEKKPHPAKYSKEILPVLRAATAGLARPLWQSPAYLLDNMGGVGGVHALARPGLITVANEIEWDWACQHISNIQGDCLDLPFADWTFDGICVSPVYFNRMSDHHNAKDGSKRNTYTHTIGHELHPNNAGKIQWGVGAEEFTWLMLAEALRVLKPGRNSRFILNISDHIRKGEVQPVSKYHEDALVWLGMRVVERYKVKTSRNRQGRNGDVRVPHENVIVFAWA